MTSDSGRDRPNTSDDVYDLHGRHIKMAAVDLTDADEPQKGRKGTKSSESGAERIHGRESHADVERGAREKMHNEAREEMVRRSKESSLPKTLSLGEGDRYKVTDKDCLSTIAERRLRTDGEKITGKTIDAEVKRLSKLNSDEHSSLEKKKDFIKTGWNLKIYDENTHRRSAPEARIAPAPAVVPIEAAKPLVRSAAPAEEPQAPHLRRLPRQPEPSERVEPPHPRHLRVVEPSTAGSDARPHRTAAALAPYHRGEVLPPPPDDGSPQSYLRAPRIGVVPPAAIPPRIESRLRPDEQPPLAPYGSEAPASPYYGAPSRQPLREPSGPEKFIGDVLSIPGKILQGIGDGLNEVFRSPTDRDTFWERQFLSYTCSPDSMAMLAADWQTGHRPDSRDRNKWESIANPDPDVGYLKDLRGVASDLHTGIQGVHTKVYQYPLGQVGSQAMQDLNKELDQGHTAVAKVQNAHTHNNHYVYIAGRDRDGSYIMGDPDRHTHDEWHFGRLLQHQYPVKPAELAQMLRPRDGFVVGWSDSRTPASQVPGTAAYRFAQRQNQLEIAARQRGNLPDQADSH